MKQGKQAVFFW